MSDKADMNEVMKVLLQHYFNVGSDGYPKDVYQDEYLEGLQDGVELVDQALQLYQNDRKQFDARYLQHRFGVDQTLSLKPITMYTMLGTYRPKFDAKAMPVFLVVHVPELKYSHCYPLSNVVAISDYDKQYENINPADNLQYHMAAAASFNELFNSDQKDSLNNFDDLDSADFLYKRGSEYANEYQFDCDDIKQVQTSEATLDLDVDALISQMRDE